MTLSIVIIGKNEEKNLKDLFHSLNSITLNKEILYVDSNSNDKSVEIAELYCDKIFQLEPSSQLCASAGRYIGTLQAKEEWILYLDGDMLLSNEFAQWINLKQFNTTTKHISGYVGEYTFTYQNSENSENHLMQRASGKVDLFGGAVLLNRHYVLEAGNWNPSVIANEEIDLYVRLQNLGTIVEAINLEMIIHPAERNSKIYTLLSLFLPLNQRYYGFGQVLRSQLEHKSLLFFIQKHPNSFIFWFLLLLSIANSYFSILLFLFSLKISFSKKAHYILLYFTDLFHALFGFFKYKKFIPKIRIR